MIDIPDPEGFAEDEPDWYLAYRRFRYDGPSWRRHLFSVAAA